MTAARARSARPAQPSLRQAAGYRHALARTRGRSWVESFKFGLDRPAVHGKLAGDPHVAHLSIVPHANESIRHVGGFCPAKAHEHATGKKRSTAERRQYAGSATRQTSTRVEICAPDQSILPSLTCESSPDITNAFLSLSEYTRDTPGRVTGQVTGQPAHFGTLVATEDGSRRNLARGSAILAGLRRLRRFADGPRIHPRGKR